MKQPGMPVLSVAAVNDEMLINCSVCAKEISIEAEACPQCGHPNRPKSAELQCYSCSAAATTKCQCCNTLSCPAHLDSVFVEHGEGGAYELRCADCYKSAYNWKIISWVFGIILLIVFLVISQR